MYKYIYIYTQQIAKIMARNVSTYKHIKTIVSPFYFYFNSQQRYAICFLEHSLACLKENPKRVIIHSYVVLFL